MHGPLSLILQIPPVQSSASLRTALLLRFTGDALSAIPGYTPDPNTLRELLNWLDDLGKAWVCVLRSQVWYPASSVGVDDSPDMAVDSSNGSSIPPVSQTDRTRLYSLLVSGEASLEEWLMGSDADG